MVTQQINFGKAVVLAAGYGSRLRPMTLETPKALVEVGGRPLVTYALDALVSCGIQDIAVVVGYQSEKIQEALEQNYPFVTFLYNDAYDGGNALSVCAARSFVSDSPFVLCMADHLIGPDLLEPMLSDAGDDCLLCVDTEAWHSSQIDDATRVMVDPAGYIQNIGKKLEAWNAIDTGVFGMTEDFLRAAEHLIERQGVQVGISDVVRFMGRADQPFYTYDVKGEFWADVDTVLDYNSVDSMIREGYGEPI